MKNSYHVWNLNLNWVCSVFRHIRCLKSEQSVQTLNKSVWKLNKKLGFQTHFETNCVGLNPLCCWLHLDWSYQLRRIGDFKWNWQLFSMVGIFRKLRYIHCSNFLVQKFYLLNVKLSLSHRNLWFEFKNHSYFFY